MVFYRHIDMGTKILEQYEAIRLGIPDGTPVTVLHIGEQQTVVATGSGAEPSAAFKLTIGSEKTAAEYFRHHPPTPAEIENAIAAVEDEIAHVRSATPVALLTQDEAIRRIARIAGLPDQPELILSRDAVEKFFEHLVSATRGRPMASESPDFFSTVLILREFMHHKQFSSISIRPSDVFNA